MCGGFLAAAAAVPTTAVPISCASVRATRAIVMYEDEIGAVAIVSLRPFSARPI